jgi:hypothetical protein
VDMLAQRNLKRKFSSRTMQACKPEGGPRSTVFPCLKVAPDGGRKRLAKVVGHEHGDGLMHHFRNRVSEDSFGGFINEENGALFFDGDDGFGSRFGDDTEKAGGLGEPLTGTDCFGGFRIPWFRHGRLFPGPRRRKFCSHVQIREGYQL